MVQQIKYYPDNSININAGPIRSFKKSYRKLLTDIIDTMKEYNLNALSAIQIGYPYQLIVIKENEEYCAYANPRIITQNKPFDSTEKSIYFRNHAITVKRYEELSIVYDDKNGDMKTKKIDNKEESATFQRKLDYIFNGTLLDRLNPNQREQAIKALVGKGIMPDRTEDYCPTFSKKEYFVSVADKLLFFMFVSLILPLFKVEKSTLNGWYTYDKFAFPTIILMMIGFFFYAQYEAKQFGQCTSCQIGNNIGVIIKRVTLATIFTIASYFILG